MEHYYLPMDQGRIPEQTRAVALGVFDGVHIGHRAVISAARHAGGGHCAVYTFMPSTKKSVRRLCDFAEESSIMQATGVNEIFEADFNEIQEMSPMTFVDKIICKLLHAHTVTCGFNFRFGKDGAGDAEQLKILCSQRGVAVRVISAVKVSNTVVSSTAIRKALEAGDMVTVHRMLGRGYCLQLPVSTGNQLGRELGVPTINQVLSDETAFPRFGVYASHIEIEDRSFMGVTNIGIHPTVGATAPVAETWIFGFTGDLYGKTVSVYPVKFLRPEKKFRCLKRLQTQIQRDAEKAAALFEPSGNVRAIIFDLDDTLYYRKNAFLHAARSLVDRYYPDITPQERERRIRQMEEYDIGDYPALIQKSTTMWEPLPDVDQEVALHRFYADFAAYCRLYTDVIETLQTLRERGVAIGVLTNGDTALQNAKIDHCGLRPLTDICMVAGDEGHQKPDPVLFRRIAGRLGVPCRDCLFIGDDPNADVRGAVKVGMRAALVHSDSDKKDAPASLPAVAILRTIKEVLDMSMKYRKI